MEEVMVMALAWCSGSKANTNLMMAEPRALTAEFPHDGLPSSHASLMSTASQIPRAGSTQLSSQAVWSTEH